MNLLPKTEKDILKKGLKLRFVVVSSFLLSVSFLVGLVMVLPSYFLVSSRFPKVDTKSQFLALEDDESVKKILNLPAEINTKLNLFQSNFNNVSIAEYFSSIAGHLPNEVQLNSLSFSKNQNYNEKNGTLILVSGTAETRDSLVLFSTLLKKSNLFSVVEIPVSSLTRDKNLPFSMNILIEK